MSLLLSLRDRNGVGGTCLGDIGGMGDICSRDSLLRGSSSGGRLRCCYRRRMRARWGSFARRSAHGREWRIKRACSISMVGSVKVSRVELRCILSRNIESLMNRIAGSDLEKLKAGDGLGKLRTLVWKVKLAGPSDAFVCRSRSEGRLVQMEVDLI